MSLLCVSYSDVGPKHSTNEDSVLCVPALGLFALADGMSGGAGDVASGLAVEALHEYFKMAAEEKGTQPIQELLQEAILGANYVVFQRSISSPEYIGIGTTLTAVVEHERQLVLGHVGDSRGYLLREGSLRQLTNDHTVRSSETNRRLLTRGIGLKEGLDIDIVQCPIFSEDLLVICSDGISDHVTEAELQELLPPSAVTERELERAARSIALFAKAQGSDDDTSIILLKAGSA